jgi:thioredoxin reductase (NADPH)
MESYDVAVLGAGLAGLSAAMCAARYGLKTVVIDRMGAGGQIVTATSIENLPGLSQGVSGYELGPQVFEQAEAAGAEFRIDTVDAISADSGKIAIICAGETIDAKALIVALGSSPRSLGVPGEAEFVGKGVSHCASCDAPMFAGKPVVVVGGGDTALDEALVLAERSQSVLIVTHGRQLRAQATLIARAKSLPNIEIRFETAVEEVAGDVGVTHVVLRDLKSGLTSQAPCDGIFVCIGTTPNSELLRGVVELDADGRISTDIMMCTSVPTIFAAGDIRAESVGLLAACAGDGATAATAAWRAISQAR